MSILRWRLSRRRTLGKSRRIVLAISETDDGSLLVLPGGRMVQIPQTLKTVLLWLDGRE